MIAFIVFMLLASASFVMGVGYDWEMFTPIKWFLILTGMSFGVGAIWLFFREIMIDTTENRKKLEWAKAKPVIDILHGFRNLSPKATEIVAKQMYFHIEGSFLNDEGILWRVNFPGGTVELEFIEQFLKSSLTTAPYSFPIRDHQHRDFAEFTNVEEKLSTITNALKYKGWLLNAEGPYSAKLAPNETFENIGNRFGLAIR